MNGTVLDVRIDPTGYSPAAARIIEWSRGGEGRVVIPANVHVVMEAYDSEAFRNVVNSADLVTPDGMPLVWALRWMGHPDQARVYGPDLMLHVLKAAAGEGIPVGFFGGSAEVLSLLVEKMQARFPALRIVYQHSPPFRPLAEQEEKDMLAGILESGARILFVGLGCPKQEMWMAAQREELPLVMLGVGAAFDFLSGSKRQAPAWMQRAGLEWLFRLIQEPDRLWRRYFLHNPRFVLLVLFQFLGIRVKQKV